MATFPLPPDKGGMRGVCGGKSCKKPISSLQTPPVLPLSGEGRNGKHLRHSHIPPDKGGMRGVWGGKSCKKPIPSLQTTPVLPLSGEGRNNERSRIVMSLFMRLPCFLVRLVRGEAGWRSLRYSCDCPPAILKLALRRSLNWVDLTL
jgi:hypothetical protein